MHTTFLTKLRSNSFRTKGLRRWHLHQVRHVYRTQMERILTLKLHVAKLTNVDQEVCQISLELARTLGAHGLRGLAQAIMQLDRTENEDLYAVIDVRLNQLRESQAQLNEVFALVLDCKPA